MGGSGATDGLKLGVREDAPGHEVPREHRAVVARRRRGRRHRGRLDEARRVRAGPWGPDARAVGVEHARCKRAGLGDLLGGLDEERESVREGPRRPGLLPRCHLRYRARWRGAQTGDAGYEEGEEVELFDRVLGRACCDV